MVRTVQGKNTHQEAVYNLEVIISHHSITINHGTKAVVDLVAVIHLLIPKDSYRSWF